MHVCFGFFTFLLYLIMNREKIYSFDRIQIYERENSTQLTFSRFLKIYHSDDVEMSLISLHVSFSIIPHTLSCIRSSYQSLFSWWHTNDSIYNCEKRKSHYRISMLMIRTRIKHSDIVCVSTLFCTRYFKSSRFFSFLNTIYWYWIQTLLRSISINSLFYYLFYI